MLASRNSPFWFVASTLASGVSVEVRRIRVEAAFVAIGGARKAVAHSSSASARQIRNVEAIVYCLPLLKILGARTKLPNKAPKHDFANMVHFFVNTPHSPLPTRIHAYDATVYATVARWHGSFD